MAARRKAAGVIGMDFVKEVTTPAAYDWDPRRASERCGLADRCIAPSDRPAAETAADQHRIVAYDYGIKRNILRRLRQDGFEVQVVPATRRRPRKCSR